MGPLRSHAIQRYVVVVVSVLFPGEWPKDHLYVQRLRELNRDPDADYETFRKAVENPDKAIRANAIIGLVKVTNYLLDQQIRQLERAFLKEGGLRERMTRARLDARAKQQGYAS